MRFSRFLFYLLFLAIHCVSANALASTINYKLIGTITQ
jgi:hypothetical protein